MRARVLLVRSDEACMLPPRISPFSRAAAAACTLPPLPALPSRRPQERAWAAPTQEERNNGSKSQAHSPFAPMSLLTPPQDIFGGFAFQPEELPEPGGAQVDDLPTLFVTREASEHANVYHTLTGLPARQLYVLSEVAQSPGWRAECAGQ